MEAGQATSINHPDRGFSLQIADDLFTGNTGSNTDKGRDNMPVRNPEEEVGEADSNDASSAGDQKAAEARPLDDQVQPERQSLELPAGSTGSSRSPQRVRSPHPAVRLRTS